LQKAFLFLGLWMEEKQATEWLIQALLQKDGFVLIQGFSTNKDISQKRLMSCSF